MTDPDQILNNLKTNIAWMLCVLQDAVTDFHFSIGLKFYVIDHMIKVKS